MMAWRKQKSNTYRLNALRNLASGYIQINTSRLQQIGTANFT
jgi:hypothetical protein